ncbi:MAG: hypothetical protein AAF066_03190 [Pseudomonadota bacterium]
MADDPRYVDDEDGDGLPMDFDLWLANDAEFRRRFGDLNDHARDIAAHFYRVPTNYQTELVFQRLKEAAPRVMKAQVENTRRYQWTKRSAERGGKRLDKLAKVTNHDLGADPSLPVVKYRTDQLDALWEHVFYMGKGSTVPKLYDHDGQIITRDMLRKMEKPLMKLADDLGIKGSLQFRYQDQDGGPGDLDKPIEELTDMKRLALMFARAFCIKFEPEDFTR